MIKSCYLPFLDHQTHGVAVRVAKIIYLAHKHVWYIPFTFVQIFISRHVFKRICICVIKTLSDS
jgi:hypothetical protein